MQLAKEVKFRFYKNKGIRRGRLIRLQLWNLGDAQNAELGGDGRSCYSIQHPSNFTADGYKQSANLVINAYDNDWDTLYIFKKYRKIVKSIGKRKPYSKRGKGT